MKDSERETVAVPPVAVEQEPAPEEISPVVSAWFIAACLVLPVIWGVLVHEVFRRWRNDSETPTEESDSVWPDYQI